MVVEVVEVVVGVVDEEVVVLLVVELVTVVVAVVVVLVVVVVVVVEVEVEVLVVVVVVVVVVTFMRGQLFVNRKEQSEAQHEQSVTPSVCEQLDTPESRCF